MQKNSASESGVFRQRVLVALSLCFLGALLAMFSFATPSPPSGTLTTAGQTITYTDAGPFVTNPSHLALGQPDCTAPNSCSDFALTVNAPGLASTHQIVVQIKWPTQANDYDTFLEDSAGNVVGQNLST